MKCEENSEKPEMIDVTKGATNDVIKAEPVTKEKLRYLRYFRLVSHRKRNGEIYATVP